MRIDDKTILITGSNRGIGRALIEAALERGARRVYAGARTNFRHPDPRVTPLRMDVTDPGQLERASTTVDRLDILVNNAGIALYDDLTDPAVIEQHLAVNLYGMLRVTRAFLPQLIRSGGALVNHLSIVALAPFPPIPAYSVSKAAAASLTQSLRSSLASQGVSVHGVYLGPVDTDMNRGLDIPKAPADAVAREILDGLEAGEEDIFPDPVSRTLAEGWRTGVVKSFERQNAAAAAAWAAAR